MCWYFVDNVVFDSLVSLNFDSLIFHLTANNVWCFYDKVKTLPLNFNWNSQLVVYFQQIFCDQNKQTNT